jgi:hypothetical protein
VQEEDVRLSSSAICLIKFRTRIFTVHLERVVKSKKFAGSRIRRRDVSKDVDLWNSTQKTLHVVHCNCMVLCCTIESCEWTLPRVNRVDPVVAVVVITTLIERRVPFRVQHLLLHRMPCQQTQLPRRRRSHPTLQFKCHNLLRRDLLHYLQ